LAILRHSRCGPTHRGRVRREDEVRIGPHRCGRRILDEPVAAVANRQPRGLHLEAHPVGRRRCRSGRTMLPVRCAGFAVGSCGVFSHHLVVMRSVDVRFSGRCLARIRAERLAQRSRGRSPPEDGYQQKARGASIKAAHASSIARHEYLFSERLSHSAGVHNAARLSLSALPITETELNVIAALAIIGLRSSPNHGYRIPAAIGTPARL
jgi:hypothetical protein